MEDNVNEKEIFDILHPRRLFIPIIVGILVIIYIISRDPSFKLSNLLLIKNIRISGIVGTLIMLFIRDFLYMFRIRLLTNRQLSWYECFEMIALWEFSSAVTPSVVGGGVVAVFLFMKNGISFGRAIAYVMATSTFDNIFFLITGPFAYFELLKDQQFYHDNYWMFAPFGISYMLILSYVSIMSVTLFFKPTFFKWIMVKITTIGVLKRFKDTMIKQSNELIIASNVLRRNDIKFWMSILVITLLTWFSRYAILNCLITCFVDCSLSTHIDIMCKHLIMWVTMLISPTPGGSGVVEYCFNCFYKDMLSNYSIIVSVIWRIVTYYLYLTIGAIMLPNWLKSLKNKRNEER